MTDSNILILKGPEILALLDQRETDIIAMVRQAYEIHGRNASSLPHSTFLRFPDSPRNRIIALPAFLGEDFNLAGVKWIASFPGNHDRGLARASAVVIINSAETGLPQAILEGSIISAKRTAASAALAAQFLHGDPEPQVLGLIGCGLINFEVARFLLAVFPSISRLVLYDTLPTSAQRFAAQAPSLRSDLELLIVEDTSQVFGSAPLVSLATTAIEPHISDLSACAPGSTILHVSLRDFTPELILAADNVVDDVDHVSRAQTSIHLAEQLTGNRDFVRCTLADITSGAAPARPEQNKITIFSPFGLGVLDLAVSHLVLSLAREQQIGTTISGFLPIDG
jgi:N-[(2S)-2-amino-2-carboxyethyl]-L-glutamate dehydrogenase